MSHVFDIQKIMEILPHRYPFLLIDRVLEITPGEKIVAMKNVTLNEPFFQGHFPQAPIMPGVLIIEALAQAGGVLAALSSPNKKNRKGELIYFMGMDHVRFRKPVVPGDQLILDMKLLKIRTNAAKMLGKAFVNKNLVAEAELMATFREK